MADTKKKIQQLFTLNNIFVKNIQLRALYNDDYSFVTNKLLKIFFIFSLYHIIQKDIIKLD